MITQQPQIDLPYLQGSWLFERSITGFPAMTGQATFVHLEFDPGALSYREELKFPAPSGEMLSGFREYIYRLIDGQLTLYFSDAGKQGGLFMKLDSSGPREGELSGSHLCKADLYKGELSVIDQNQFRIRYTVTGPKKNHVLDTLYSRVRGHEELVDRRRESA
jgi:hypothetical protein